HDDRVELWCVTAAGSRPVALVTEPGDVLRYAWLDDVHLVVETATPRATLQAIAARQQTFGFAVDDDLEPYYSLRPIPQLTAQRSRIVVDVDPRGHRPASDAEIALLNGPSRTPAPPEAISVDRASGDAVWVTPRTAGDRTVTPLLGLYRQ